MIGRLLGRLLGPIGCILVIVLIVAAVAGAAALGLFFERINATPGEQVRAYVRAIDDDDVPGAHGALCRALRGKYTQQAFAREIERQKQGLGPIQGFEVTDTFPRAVDRYSVYFRLRGTVRSRQIEATVIPEEGWRICELEWPDAAPIRP